MRCLIFSKNTLGASSRALLSEVQFGSYLVYSPRGKSDASKKAKEVCYGIKGDRSGLIAHVAKRLSEDFSSTELSAVLGPDVSLVPAPKSAPLVAGGLWVPKRICDELVKMGLGRETLPLVSRARAVPKAAMAAAGERPTVQTHFESFRLDTSLVPPLAPPPRITVVDDVITRGATTLAVASLIVAHFPGSEVRVFAAVRTMSNTEVSSTRDPVLGTITRNPWGETHREP